MNIVQARTAAEIGEALVLCREYVAGLGIPIALTGFEAEAASWPGRYAPPGGALLLAQGESGRPIGCVGVGPLAIAGACELKRLYVRAEARGTGAGRALVSAALAVAVAAGYTQAYLDTLPFMAPAQALYRSLGFVPVPPYWDNQAPGIIYFGKQLP